MAQNTILEKVQDLGDLELAILLCLIAKEHCIIQAAKEDLEDLKQELCLISSKVFDLSCALVDCSTETTLEEFGEAILAGEDDASIREHKLPYDNHMNSPPADTKCESSNPPSPEPRNALDERKVANVVVARDLNRASLQIQLQALELIRAKRIFSRTAVHTAPKRFLFIALLSEDPTALGLSKHLNDHFAISHYHSPEDGLHNLDTYEEHLDNTHGGPPRPPKFNAQDIGDLQETTNIKMTAEVRAYLHNIVTFLRLHRCVAGGVSALATRHFHALVRALAPLHGLSYVTPSLVALAARKIYPHRIILATPDNERSLQWGSDRAAVAALLEGVTVHDVIEDVLSQVDVPA